MVRTDAILRSFDQILGTQLMEQMKTDGVKFETHDSIDRVDKEGELLKVTTKAGKTIQDVGCLLWAIGRDPYVKDLGKRNSLTDRINEATLHVLRFR